MSKKNRLPQIRFSEDYRSYIIVALTVLNSPVRYGPMGELIQDPSARTVIQPAGRLAAQVGHIVDIISTRMLKRYIYQHTNVDRLLLIDPQKKDAGFWNSPPTPLTRIILAARDSYELSHVYGLLKKAGIAVHWFFDENEEAYDGDCRVLTAIGTEPIRSEDTIGLIDYLPLWTPDK